MARYKDLNNKWNNVKWDGADPDVINFRNELYDMFPQLRVTSAVRTGSGVGKSGSKSRHNRGQALDLAVDKDLHKFLYSTAGDALLRKYNLGFLDESLKHNLKATGGTGAHFHIGKDSTLSGNSHKGNTAFKVETSQGLAPAPAHDHSHDEDVQDPNQVAYVPDTPGTSPEFFEQIYREKEAREAQLAEQYEAEKASVARQNAVQEGLKQKMENQASILDMISNHDLGTVSRAKPSMEDGGEFQGLNDNLKFKIDAIKANMPDFKSINPEDSEIFRELSRTRASMDEIRMAAQQSIAQGRGYVSPGTLVQQDSQPVEESEVVSAQPKPLESTSTANKLHNKLATLGLKTHQIAGIVGSLSGESGINLSSTAKNPHSGAFGIAQWLGSRLTGLKQFGKDRGRDFKNEDVQIEYLLHELQNTSEKKSLGAIKKAKNIQEATMIWTRQFERPSEKEIVNSIGQRVKNAQMFQKQFS